MVFTSDIEDSVIQEPVVEGQILSTNLINENTLFGAMFMMGKENSKLGGHLTYMMNDYLHLTVVGNIDQKRVLGATFWLSGHFPIYKQKIVPFILLDNSRIGEMGMIYYFNVGTMPFHVGTSYNRQLSQENISSVSFIFGSSINKQVFKSLDD